MICLPIVAKTNTEAFRLLELAGREPADLFELRFDLWEEAPDIAGLLRAAARPVIATCRSREQGGNFSGDTAARLALLQAAMDAGAEYVDAEEDVIGGLKRHDGVVVIASWHDFGGIPADLRAVSERLAATPCDWVKFAVTPKKLSDNFTVLDAIRASRKPAIGIAMGELGLATRILGPAHGSMLTFGTLSAGLESAPGQTTVRQLAEIYRLKTITRNTAVYGLAGDPVRHSAGPVFHNRAFAALGIDAVYIPFLCSDLGGFVKDAPRVVNLRGLSVTMPLKHEALAVADRASEVATRSGAANTLSLAEGAWHADNTDFSAVAGGVGDRARQAGIVLEKAEALLLGTGGAARAIGGALESLGCRVTVSGRNPDKTRALAAAMGWDKVEWDARTGGDWKVVANSTPIGMSPRVDETPFPAGHWHSGMAAFDAVYHPRKTRFLREAAEAGAVTVDGVDMFIRQGMEQFRLWTGRDIPEGLRHIPEA